MPLTEKVLRQVLDYKNSLMMKRKIIIATKNKGKIKEFKNILSDNKFEISSLIDINNLPDINEDGNSFKDNAVKKSRHIFEMTGKPCIADDSGLEIDYLNGAPGVKSSRFCGISTPQKLKNEKIISMMKGAKENERSAQFKCVIAYTDNNEKKAFDGICKGRISDKPKGENGFGYDPIFIPEGFDKTFGEIDEDVKNRISHRAKALREFYNWFLKNN